MKSKTSGVSPYPSMGKAGRGKDPSNRKTPKGSAKQTPRRDMKGSR